ncbi:MAG: type II toxin-antitoxin system Phd/YefM family antitoxin [Spirochaetaceae bacterium]|nr:MAG: type II toxin-antitoxin system Phd/YefM family antitoxin [Spirochaetaceae bacterium]
MIADVRTFVYYVRMKISPTELRQNLYRIIDTAIETGEVVEIVRNGRIVRLIPESRASIWDRLEVHEVISGDPEDLVHNDWSSEWKAEDV